MIENEVGALLKSTGLTVSVAEACTSGLVASRLTSVAGSSGYFVGGVLAYANEVKERLLHVPKGLMVREGSVSEATALAMARGAKKLLKADLAVGATGVMGPGGGTVNKPVGLFFVAVVGPGNLETCERHQFHGDRAHNRGLASEVALVLLKNTLRSLSTNVPTR